MSRFKKYINEKTNLKSDYGAGITFIDIDETIFRTFAKMIVRDKITGVINVELDNMEFNSYKLKDGEEYDYHQFRDAALFRKTSIPIPQTVKRIKKMIKGIASKYNRDSKIIFLTARSDLDNKHEVLNTFRDHGIKMDPSIVYVERAGNDQSGTIPEVKQKIMLKYLMTGKYRRVRLLDDHKPNVKALLDIKKKFGKQVDNKVIKFYNIPEDENFPVVQYFGLWVKPNGSLEQVK